MKYRCVTSGSGLAILVGCYMVGGWQAVGIALILLGMGGLFVCAVNYFADEYG